MRKKYLFALGFVLSALPVKASNDDSRERRLIIKASAKDSAHPQFMQDINKHFLSICKNKFRMMDASDLNMVQVAEEIIDDYNKYAKSVDDVVRISRELNLKGVAFGYKRLRQVYFTTSTAYLIKIRHENKTEPIHDADVQRIKNLCVSSIEHCRNFLDPSRVPLSQVIDANDSILLSEDEKTIVLYGLAEQLNNLAILCRGEIKKQYDLFIESAKIFDVLSHYSRAYAAYFNAYEMLKIHPDNIDNIINIKKSLEGKLKMMWSSLPKEERMPHLQSQRAEQDISVSARAAGHEKRKAQKIARSRYEDLAEQFESAVNYLAIRNDASSYLYNVRSAARAYQNAAVLSRVPEHKQGLYLKVTECAKKFEAMAAKALSLGEGNLNDLNGLCELYKQYYASKLDICIVAHNYAEMLCFIEAFIHVGEFEQAKMRCEALLKLEGKPARVNAEAATLGMFINAAMGNTAELEKAVEAAKDIKKSASKKKKERQQRKKLEQIQEIIQQKEARAAEALVAETEKLPEPAPAPVQRVAPGEQDRMPFVSTTHLSQGRVENYKNEYRGANSNIDAPEKPAVAEASPAKPKAVVAPKKVEKKLLSQKVFTPCHNLLKGGKDCKSMSRDDILKLFVDLGYIVDHSRGKGSHSMIMIRSKSDNKIVGGIPFLEEREQNPHDDGEEEALNNAALPIPQWEGPAPFYIIKSIQNLLNKLGYTLDSIELEKQRNGKKK